MSNNINFNEGFYKIELVSRRDTLLNNGILIVQKEKGKKSYDFTFERPIKFFKEENASKSYKIKESKIDDFFNNINSFKENIENIKIFDLKNQDKPLIINVSKTKENLYNQAIEFIKTNLNFNVELSPIIKNKINAFDLIEMNVNSKLNNNSKSNNNQIYGFDLFKEEDKKICTELIEKHFLKGKYKDVLDRVNVEFNIINILNKLNSNKKYIDLEILNDSNTDQYIKGIGLSDKINKENIKFLRFFAQNELRIIKKNKSNFIQNLKIYENFLYDEKFLKEISRFISQELKNFEYKGPFGYNRNYLSNNNPKIFINYLYQNLDNEKLPNNLKKISKYDDNKEVLKLFNKKILIPILVNYTKYPTEEDIFYKLKKDKKEFEDKINIFKNNKNILVKEMMNIYKNSEDILSFKKIIHKHKNKHGDYEYWLTNYYRKTNNDNGDIEIEKYDNGDTTCKIKNHEFNINELLKTYPKILEFKLNNGKKEHIDKIIKDFETKMQSSLNIKKENIKKIKP